MLVNNNYNFVSCIRERILHEKSCDNINSVDLNISMLLLNVIQKVHVHVLYMYSTCTVHVQYMDSYNKTWRTVTYSTCTVHG